MTEFSSRLELDNLPGMINRDRLQYQPESGLREVCVYRFMCFENKISSSAIDPFPKGNKKQLCSEISDQYDDLEFQAVNFSFLSINLHSSLA